MSVYINGVFNANNGANGYGAWTSVGLTGLTIGALGASYFGNVKLDDVRVYNVALTDTQILELYKGRVSFINFISPTSGGSGGGSYMNSTGASAGTVWNATYSKVNAGLSSTTTGGNGGSALSNGGVISSINGSAYTYGTGGSATVINSTKKYGDGADYTGNAGNGIVIIKTPYVLPYTIIKLTDGTANNPVYTFSSENSTGMFKSSTNTIGFTINGSEIVKINSAGLMINGTQFTGGSGGSTTSITASAPLSLTGTALSLTVDSTLTTAGGLLQLLIQTLSQTGVH